MQESTQETSNRSPAFGLQVGEGGLVSGPILVGASPAHRVGHGGHGGHGDDLGGEQRLLAGELRPHVSPTAGIDRLAERLRQKDDR